MKPNIPLRRFQVELKHRPPDDETGEREELVETVEMRVPRLAKSAWEERWVTLSVWNYLSTAKTQNNNINQAFIFSADYSKLIMRLEVNPFHDEEVKVLNPPSQNEHDQWRKAVEKQFRRLYGIDMSKWQKEAC